MITLDVMLFQDDQTILEEIAIFLQLEESLLGILDCLSRGSWAGLSELVK